MSEPREILSLVPYRLGFRPAESVVAVSLRAPRGRVGLMMRIDLDDLAHAESGPQVARAMVATLGADGAHSSLLVVYVADDPRVAHAAASSSVSSSVSNAVSNAVSHYREAAEAPLGPTTVWVVTSTGYLSLDCMHGCCPPGGRPLQDLESTRVSAHMVLDGQVVVDSRDDLVRFPTIDSERRRTVARMRRRWTERAREAHLAGEPAAVRWRRESLAAWRVAVAHTAAVEAGVPVEQPHAPWGRVEAGLQDVRVRDAVLVALVPGTGNLAERSLLGTRPSSEVDAQIGAAIAKVVSRETGSTPPPEATLLHERTLEGVVAHGARGAQAPALTLLGWLAWWRGDGTRARMLLERALLDDEDYRLAVLLTATIVAACPPGWAQRDARWSAGTPADHEQ
ncbi:DUF4192 domain-containing protein [Cellulomonas composti]|uniref:DUF4192 domain-containing protein n=1 Tax=Cellulomonas composti TaxID=266130 RepID=UPI001FE3F002|nr:DUF4192 domain-containing protein [Cellulomonas composti]